MKGFFLLAVLVLAGCSAGLKQDKTPFAPLDMRQAVRISGVYEPYGLDFTAVSVYDGNSVRMVVLSALGSKLAALTVTPTEIRLYEKVPQLPARLAAGFGRMARARLQCSCPETDFTHEDPLSRGRLVVQTQGGAACR